MFKPVVKTVDGVMAVFSKTITDLETVADNNEMNVVDMQAQKSLLDTRIGTASIEASRARNIAKSLTKLLA